MHPFLDGWVTGIPLSSKAYELVLSERVVSGKGGHRRPMGARDGFCRVCGGRGDDLTFRSDAHIISQAMGNRRWVTLEECDRCNRDIGGPLEDDLARFLLFDRVNSQVKTGRKPPKLKVRRGGSSVSRTPDGRVVVDATPGDGAVDWRQVDRDGTTQVEALLPPFSPMNVGRSVARMAVLAVPRLMLGEFSDLVRWVRRESTEPCVLTRAAVSGVHSPLLTLQAWRARPSVDDLFPRWLFAFGWDQVLLVVHVGITAPMEELDLNMLQMPRFIPPGRKINHVPMFSRVATNSEDSLSNIWAVTRVRPH